MNKKEYHRYLESPEWKAISDAKKESVENKCEICGEGGVLHSHHLHYRNIGHENLEDLLVVCPEHHQEITDANTSSGKHYQTYETIPFAKFLIGFAIFVFVATFAAITLAGIQSTGLFSTPAVIPLPEDVGINCGNDLGCYDEALVKCEKAEYFVGRNKQLLDSGFFGKKNQPVRIDGPAEFEGQDACQVTYINMCKSTNFTACAKCHYDAICYFKIGTHEIIGCNKIPIGKC